MKLSPLLFTAGLIVAGTATISYTGFAQGIPGHPHHVMGSSPSSLLHEAMMAPMQHMKPMTGDPDRDFAAMMADHHQSAVEMAKLELKYGKNSELKRLSKNIIRTQTQEIKILRKHF